MRKPKSALLIIDMQLGAFRSPLIPPVFRADELLERVERLLRWAREGNAQVLFVQHCGPQGHPLEEKTAATAIHPSLAPRKGEPVILKRHSDAFFKTNLQRELKARGIKKLIIAGIQSDFCVDTACRRAFSSGYAVTLAQDAHSTWDNGTLTASQIIAHHNAVLGNGFCRLASTKEITTKRNP